MKVINFRAEIESWSLRAPFRISDQTFENVEVVVVTLEKNGSIGRGEASGVFYNNDTPVSMITQLQQVRALVEAGMSRQKLRAVLPPGGARNALDCAMWDLEARLSGRRAWEIAGLEEPKPLLTTYTCSLDEPEHMARAASDYSQARAIKLKLAGDPLDVERVKVVRRARPDVWLGVDANRSFTRPWLEALLPTLVEQEVALIEQPFPIGKESLLDNLRSPVPIAADESAQSLVDISRLVGRFDVINIKLDKCGGLTEGLDMARAVRAHGMSVMVGNMLGTSLAMAPAHLLGQLCAVVDLDGPIFLNSDRGAPAEYIDGHVTYPKGLWG